MVLAMAKNVQRQFVHEKLLDETQFQYDILREPHCLGVSGGTRFSGSTKKLSSQKLTCARMKIVCSNCWCQPQVFRFAHQ